MAGSVNNSDDYSPVAEINITPLVDVMLVLLIIFMVTAPLLESGIPIQLPKTANSGSLSKGQKSINLQITQDKLFFINGQPVNSTRLISALQEVYKNRKKKEIFIRADGALPYSFVAQTMAAIKAAGIHKIGLVTSSGPEQDRKTRKKKR